MAEEKKLTMDEGEIARNYRMSKEKREQLKILAELNATTKEHIVEILLRQGVKPQELPRQRKGALEGAVPFEKKKNKKEHPDAGSETFEEIKAEDYFEPSCEYEKIVPEDYFEPACDIPEEICKEEPEKVTEATKIFNEKEHEIIYTALMMYETYLNEEKNAVNALIRKVRAER